MPVSSLTAGATETICSLNGFLAVAAQHAEKVFIVHATAGEMCLKIAECIRGRAYALVDAILIRRCHRC